jgi:hypothetical protein
MMSVADLREEIKELITAGFSGVWVQTYDVHEATLSIVNLLREHQWNACVWDCAVGFSFYDPEQNAFTQLREEKQTPSGSKEWVNKQIRDLPAAIKAFIEFAESVRGDKKEDPVATVFVVKNPHFAPPQQSSMVLQLLETEAVAGRQERRHVLCVSTQGNIPKELSKQYISVEHPLPDREKLADVLELLVLEEDEQPEDEDAVLDACMGMTNVEASNSMALSVVRDGIVRPEQIWDVKAQILKKAKGLSLWRGKESFKLLGGLNNLKQYCLRSIQNSRVDEPMMQAKGVLLLGVPGSGKSAFSKALGYETRRPTIMLDVGSLMGQFVGQTEGNTREAIQVIDAMAPAILMIDEVEKALAAGEQAHEVSTRMMGTFLTWLQDHESDVFVICTCNDIHRITQHHPEFARVGRFDGVFFVDLPTRQEKDAIWDIHLRRYERFGIRVDQDRPQDEKWTGAEIEGCVRQAALHVIPLIEAARNIVPIAESSSEKIESLRDWATNRVLSATHADLYQGQKHLALQAKTMQFGNGSGRRLGKRRKRRPSGENN